MSACREAELNFDFSSFPGDIVCFGIGRRFFRPISIRTTAGRPQKWVKNTGGSRVDEGDCSPPPPTDPDVHNSCIRLLIAWSRCNTIVRLAPLDPERSWPPPLPFEVSLRRSQNSMFLPSFPSKSPCYGTPFPPQGPLGQVPLTLRYYSVLRLPFPHLFGLRCLRPQIPPLTCLFRSSWGTGDPS